MYICLIFISIYGYFSKLSKILEDTSKFKRVNIEEGKTLNHLTHMEERIIRLLKSLENQGEISEKKRNDKIDEVLNQDFYMGSRKSMKH